MAILVGVVINSSGLFHYKSRNFSLRILPTILIISCMED